MSRNKKHCLFRGPPWIDSSSRICFNGKVNKFIHESARTNIKQLLYPSQLYVYHPATACSLAHASLPRRIIAVTYILTIISNRGERDKRERACMFLYAEWYRGDDSAIIYRLARESERIVQEDCSSISKRWLEIWSKFQDIIHIYTYSGNRQTRVFLAESSLAWLAPLWRGLRAS